jgi:hypothetical protein
MTRVASCGVMVGGAVVTTRLQDLGDRRGAGGTHHRGVGPGFLRCPARVDRLGATGAVRTQRCVVAAPAAGNQPGCQPEGEVSSWPNLLHHDVLGNSRYNIMSPSATWSVE